MKAAAKGYFGKSLDRPDASPRPPSSPPSRSRRPSSTWSATPSEVCLEDVADGEECTEVQARRAAATRDRPAPQPRPRPDEDAQHADRRASTPPPSTRRPRTSRSSCASRSRPTGRRRTSSGRSAESSAEILCPDTPDDCEEVDTGGYQVITTLDWTMQQIAEKWVYAAARAPNAKDPTRGPRRAARSPTASGAGSWACAATTSTTRRPAVIDYRTGEVLAYVGQRQLHVQGQQEVPAPVRRPRRRLAPARVGDQAGRLPRSASTTRR